MKRIALVSLVTVFAVAAGCSSSSNDAGGSGDDGTTADAVDGGASKDAAATSDGSSPSADAGSSKDAASVTDASKKDGSSNANGDASAGADASAGSDAGLDADVSDADADADRDGEAGAPSDAGTCSPVLNNFAPTFKPPGALHQNKCTQAQLDAVIAACADGSTYTAAGCTAAKSANATCASCMITDLSAATLGAFIEEQDGAEFYLNIAGCITATENDGATGCGAKVQAYQECQAAACSSVSCTVVDDATDTNYDDCKFDASGSVCASYEPDSECDTAALMADASVLCDPNGYASYLDAAKAYATLFCMAP